uniref:Uncharacterized protein n=1 Tax=Timema poppense TaxID=170557 RepID=A0A7R9DTA4_TIMPO|nr:unnamed protein product [Timema poppensis]
MGQFTMRERPIPLEFRTWLLSEHATNWSECLAGGSACDREWKSDWRVMVVSGWSLASLRQHHLDYTRPRR